MARSRNFSLKQTNGSLRRPYKRRVPQIKYDPDRHCGVLNHYGRPCTRVITCHIHKIKQKLEVPGRRDSVRNMTRRYKLNAARASASKTKGIAYNPDKHCGVKSLYDYPCMKVITCNTHLMRDKRDVQGRGSTIAELLKEHKKSLAGMTKAERKKNSGLPQWRKKLIAQMLYNPDKNCGVKDSRDLPCLRVVTCDIHKIAQKRAVPGRSKLIQELIKEYKMKRQKKTPKLEIPENAGTVLFSPIKVILPKRTNNSVASTSSQVNPEPKQVRRGRKKLAPVKRRKSSTAADMEKTPSSPSCSKVQQLGKETYAAVQPCVARGTKPASFILRKQLAAKGRGKPNRARNSREVYSRQKKNNNPLMQPAEASTSTIATGSLIDKEPSHSIADREVNIPELPPQVIEQKEDQLKLLLPITNQEADLEEFPLPVLEADLQKLLLPIIDQDTILQQLHLPILDQEAILKELPFSDEEANLQGISNQNSESTEKIPEHTDSYSVSAEDIADLEDFSEFMNIDFNMLDEQELDSPVMLASQNMNQNSGSDISLPSLLGEAPITESLESYPIPIEDADLMENYSEFVQSQPLLSADVVPMTAFSDQLMDSHPVSMHEIEDKEIFFNSTKCLLPIEGSLQSVEESEPAFLISPSDIYSVINPLEYSSVPFEDIDIFRSFPQSLTSDLTATIFTSSHPEEIKTSPPTNQIEDQFLSVKKRSSSFWGTGTGKVQVSPKKERSSSKSS